MCIIPGTAAVAGITRVDEPVGELLDRFERRRSTMCSRRRAGTPSHRVMARRHDDTGASAVRSPWCSMPRMLWAGRISTNPVHRIAPPSDWQVHPNPGQDTVSATNPSTGARLELAGDAGGAQCAALDIWIEIPLHHPVIVRQRRCPSCPPDAATTMRSVLAIAAGSDIPEQLPTVVADGDLGRHRHPPNGTERVADHTGVTRDVRRHPVAGR